jgi:hypothetical protein
MGQGRIRLNPWEPDGARKVRFSDDPGHGFNNLAAAGKGQHGQVGNIVWRAENMEERDATEKKWQ